MILRPSLINALLVVFSATHFTLADAAERILVSRFAASGNYLSALTYGYSRPTKGVGAYKSESGFKTVKRIGGCPSLLESYQEFPLRKMVEVGYLTEAQSKAYASLGSDLHPTQMTFYTKSDTGDDHDVGEGLFARLPDHEGNTLATLYSVSSYKIDFQARTATHVPIPLELEPKWKPVLDASLPREKRLFLWEFGRAAQEAPGEIDDLLRAATLGCLNDIFSYGWAMAKNFNEITAHSHVLIHAKDRAHVIAYKKRFPTVQVISHPLDPYDAAFIVPVNELVQKYSPEKLSPRLTRIIQAAGGGIDAGQAVMVVNFLKRYRWEELNVGYFGVKSSRYPIVFSPATSGALQVTAVMNGILEEIGVPAAHTNDVLRAFGSVEQNFLVNSPGRYVDVTDPGISSPVYKAKNAQEISNLDPKEARENPYYIASVLASTYRHFLELRLGRFEASTVIPPEFMFQLDELMMKDGIKFGITTLDPVVSKMIEALGPTETVTRPGAAPTADFSGAGMGDPELAFLSRDVGKTYYMHFFTIPQIHHFGSILSKLPGNYGLAGVARSSSWQIFYDTANPEIF